MHRHFSNRGEALAEVAAAKMLASRTHLTESACRTQNGKRVTTQVWSSPPADWTRRRVSNKQKIGRGTLSASCPRGTRGGD